MSFLGLKYLHVFVSLQQMFDYSRFPKLKDPSGLWNSFIAEEGSLERAQGAVHYLCQGVAKKGAPDIFDRREKASKKTSEVRQEYTVKVQGHYSFLFSEGGDGGSSCFLNTARDS